MNLAQRNQKQNIIDIFNRRADDRIERKQTEKQLLALIEQKDTQLSVLNHVNTLLGRELAVLQKKLGIDHDNILRELQEINQISVAFHSQTEQMVYLDALLSAYDENSLRQKKLIAYLYTSLEDAQKRAQILVKDNQFLLGELQEKVKQVLQIYSKGFIDDNLISSYTKLQRETQIELIENIRNENEHLLTNYRKLEQRVQKRQKQLVEVRKSSDYYFGLYKQQAQELKELVLKYDDLLKIKDIVQKKFDEISQENLQLQTSREQLENKIVRIEAERKQYKDKYQLYRVTKYEQNDKLTREYETLKMDYDNTQKRQRQYFNRNILMEKDLQNQRDDIKLAKRELEKTKSEFEQTLKMCETYQTKINVYAKKEQLMRENLDESKQKLQNALLERDKAILKEKQQEKVLELLKQRNRQEMEAYKNTFEKLISEQNDKIQLLQSDKQDSNSIYYQNECSLKHQLQKLRKDNQLLKQENYRYGQNIRVSTGTQIVNKLRELEDKNQVLNRLISQKERSYHEEIEGKNQIIGNLEVQNRDIGRLIQRERNISREANSEKMQYKSKVGVLQREKDDIEEELARVRRSMENRAYSESDGYQEKIRELERKLNQAVKKEKQVKEKTIDMLNKYNQIEEEIKMEYENKINALTTENAVLRNKLSRR